MISNKEILKIANYLIKKLNTNCSVKIIDYRKFKFIAKKSPLISQVLREGFLFKELNLPAVIYHKKSDNIFLCKEIITKLLKNETKTNQKKFIKAIIIHELMHINNRKNLLNFDLNKSIKSEKIVFNKFRKNYPDLFNLSKEILR